ncbi:tetratricopeptide repeat protein [Candidatus Sumerlaeota bacterium]|nr:tetratricopeptide repeat protein [Candidatus Sumerlaeota bacterium]
MKIYRSCLFLILAMILYGCTKPPIIVPEFNTATEQYVFAKNLEDQTILVNPKGKERKIREESILMAYQSVIDRFPEDQKVTPLAWVELGDAFFARNDMDRSIFYYETALQKYPHQDDIVCKSLFGSARAYDRLKEYDKAIDYYKRCFQRFENDKRPFLATVGQQARINYSRIRVK